MCSAHCDVSCSIKNQDFSLNKVVTRMSSYCIANLDVAFELVVVVLVVVICDLQF